jgi:prepilin-type N-terminal cleavage/methylation domain-containing protein
MISAIRQRAFTLIELLVVIGLIAVLAGGIGVALLDGSSGNALQNSQSIVTSLTSVARSKAALEQTNAAVILNTRTTDDGFLREFRIVVRDPTDTFWTVVGDSTTLDRGIYFVNPASEFTSTVTFTGSAWTTELRSNALTNDEIPIAGIKLADGTTNLVSVKTYRIVQIYTPRGTVPAYANASATAPAGGRIVFSPGKLAADGKITFDKPDSVRGLLISDYGVSTLLNEAEALKP